MIGFGWFGFFCLFVLVFVFNADLQGSGEEFISVVLTLSMLTEGTEAEVVCS